MNVTDSRTDRRHRLRLCIASRDKILVMVIKAQDKHVEYRINLDLFGISVDFAFLVKSTYTEWNVIA